MTHEKEEHVSEGKITRIFDKNDDCNVIYAELERQIFILIDDHHDNEGLLENTTKKHSNSSWTTKS
ncbi:hypothetical protein OSB04_008901 [Centaurea solstitialis]|uniref:Uncharacterized protein n=1 Tax=Centaurea solstitialis TaxID=347529 RepID=A0AA38TY65_9ASTR|nr:hypothetical protein OSB04_008901 [Centaurea solstitialis]